MKNFCLLLAFVLGMAVNMNAITYEEAFNSIKAMPQMKGVEGTVISDDNDLAYIGISDGELVMWSGEVSGQTAPYGNALYKIMGELPAAELIKGMLNDQTIFVIFAKKVSENSNRILILSDSAGAGFTGAIIGYIADPELNALRNSILIPRPTGGTALYINAMNF